MADARRTRSSVLAAFVTCVVASTTLTACSLWSGPDPKAPLKGFVEAWTKGDLSKQSLLADDGSALPGTSAQTQLTALSGDLSALRPTVVTKSGPTVKNNEATSTATVTWPLAQGLTWTYTTMIRLKKSGKAWKVVFGPSTFEPEMAATQKLTVHHTTAARGSILDGAGAPLVTDRSVVIVGFQPNQVPNVPAAVAQLTAAIAKVQPGTTFTEVPGKLSAAKPTAFVDVITLRLEKYQQIKPDLQAIAGAQFHTSTMQLAPTSSFAKTLLGSVGDVTKEIMDKNPGVYQVGDKVGLSGLQQRYDAVLRGTPGVQVSIATAQGTAVKSLFTSDPKPGASIKTTLDQKTQTAADNALSTDSRRSAMVAVRISDGALIAVANGPNGGTINFALTAQVPPGSTFKTVTAYGVLDNGSETADTVVPCPQTLTVDGRTFQNSHEMVLGDAPLHVNFAKSCNTAFASLAPKLGSDGLAKTAASLGIGVPWDLGADVFTGKVSSGGSQSEQAAAAFGQGTTIVSPVALAGATAAVARGQWKQPTLVTDPAPAKPAADGPQLNSAALTALRGMMREVVTGGTAVALKNVDGLYGKTGTAEYDSNDPSKTHSWFIGYRGDIAFAVFVENGGLGAAAAVPITGKFFAALG